MGKKVNRVSIFLTRRNETMYDTKIIALTVIIILSATIPTYAQEAQKIGGLKTEFLCELKPYLVKPP
jgi:hypothetical protein